ncbi:MAG: ABC transporter substrate binding protein, partial [Pseudomonadota bacterium]
IPVVFCGINNSAEPYGYPYKNATGMVEITPVQPLLKAIKETLPAVKQGIFLSADVLSQRRMFERLRKSFAIENIQLDGYFVTTQNEWESVWKAANDSDFIFIGNPAGIAAWDMQRMHRFIVEQHGVFTVTVWDWLSPLAMLTVTKVPQEQGEWAAKVALEILNGIAPDKIPIVVNRRWKMYRNTRLLNYSGIKLPIGLIHNAQEVTP